MKTHKQSHKYTHTQLQMAHAHTQTLPGRCVHSLGDIHSSIAFRILLIRPLFLYSIPLSVRPFVRRQCIFCGTTDTVASQPQLSLGPPTRLSPVDCQLDIRLHLCEMVKCQNAENVHEMKLICCRFGTI